MHGSISIVLCVLFLCSSIAKVCKPDYFWRPFKGEIPPDAFIAGKDAKGKPTYVARIVPLDQYLWTTPAQLFSGEKSIAFDWYGSNSRNKVDKFIDVLCIQENHSLEWVTVDKYPDEITSKCCLIEAGIGKFANDPYIYISYVAKKIMQNVTYIGRSYNRREWHGIHVMEGSSSTKYPNNFQLLTYNCDYPKSLIDYRMNINK